MEILLTDYGPIIDEATTRWMRGERDGLSLEAYTSRALCRAQVARVAGDETSGIEGRARVGLEAVVQGGNQGFWKGYWQSLIDLAKQLREAAGGEG